jgi:uncharacterized phage infection (PIP) family protein YhgE
MMEGGRVAIRKTKASAPVAPPHKADDVPATRAMLGSVRTEVLERIDRAREEAKADAQQLDGNVDTVKAEVQQVRTGLQAEVQHVRAELKAEIHRAREEAKADAQRLDGKIDAVKAEVQQARTELKAEVQQVRTELKAEVQQVRTELKAEVQQVRAVLKAEIHEVKAGMHGIQAQMARIEFLVEEQNARNKVVLDGITAVFSRQDQVEQRVSNIEDTVRTLASARSPEGPG